MREWAESRPTRSGRPHSKPAEVGREHHRAFLARCCRGAPCSRLMPRPASSRAALRSSICVSIRRCISASSASLCSISSMDLAWCGVKVCLGVLGLSARTFPIMTGTAVCVCEPVNTRGTFRAPCEAIRQDATDDVELADALHLTKDGKMWSTYGADQPEHAADRQPSCRSGRHPRRCAETRLYRFAALGPSAMLPRWRLP